MPRPARAILMCGMMLGLASVSARVLPVAAQALNEPTQVLTRDDLRSKGVVMLTDIVQHIDDARALSLDGFEMRLSLRGIGSFHESPPAVFVDGHPIDPGLPASGDLNLIGLPVEVIERVEIFARPSLIAGVFAGQGAIHITTIQAERAAEVHGRLLVGRDDADAGVLSFPGGEQTGNEYRGPDVEAAAVGKIAGGSVLGAVVHRRYAHARQPHASRRPLSVGTSPSVVFTLPGRRLHLSVVGLGSSADRFPFLPYASRRLATNDQRAALSAMAAHPVSDRSFIRHRATMNLGRTRHGGDSGPWNESSFLWTSAITQTLDERIVVLGGTGELLRVQSGEDSGDLRWGSVFASIAGNISQGADYRGGGMVAMDGRSVAVKAYGGITLTRWEGHRADFHIAVVDGLLHEQNLAAFWAREQLPPPLFPTDLVRRAEDVTIMATFDAEWRWQPDPTREIRVGAGIRRSPKVYLPSQSIIPVPGGVQHDSIEFRYTSGTQGVFWGDFTAHVLPGRQRFFWSWQRTIVGDATYDGAWDAVPDVRAGAAVSTPMLRGFQMRAAVTRESGRTWHEFDAAPDVRSESSGVTLVDAYVTKRLFSGRLHASVGVQNLLGEDIRHHPLGETLGRSIRVDLRLELVRRR